MNAKNLPYRDPTELHCSPKAHKYAEKDSTCFTLSELKLLANEFNKRVTDPTKKIKATTKIDLVKALLKSYEKICNKHQFCWIRQTLSDSDKISELEKSFRPKKPEAWDKNNNTWLNTYDILYVMEQYQYLYKDYTFLGVYPIDFSQRDGFGRCIGDMLCDFNLEKTILSKKKKRFGIIFNTDPSTAGGSHWIGLYCNLNPLKPNYGIYYYDSVANPTPNEVVNFMKLVSKQVDDLKLKTHKTFQNKNFEFKENKIQRQFSNYDCGCYQLIFQTQCLKNIPFNVICNRMNTDNAVNRFRNILYRPNYRPKLKIEIEF
jgi:hypothetical protein